LLIFPVTSKFIIFVHKTSFSFVT